MKWLLLKLKKFVMPKSQVQSLYSHNKSNKENKKPQEKNKVQDKGDKKTQKKEQIQEVLKLKPPKSIESALNLTNEMWNVHIDIYLVIHYVLMIHADHASAISMSKKLSLFLKRVKISIQMPPIVWLKVLVQFLNQKVPIEAHDPVFSSKPKGFPFSVVQSGIRTVIEKALKEAGKSNSQLFFDICLTSMVTDMSKGLPAMGYRFFLQYIATNEPKLVTASISKHVTLRNSYQNRPNIGLSILWAVGHVGINDLHCGVTAFQEVFLPLIDMKNYSSFVAKYLLDLISRNNNDDSLSRDEYLLILDTIYSNKKEPSF
ncbi:hypothetical protein NQ317_008432 [Molorchus minor]|uniref:Uncharacterized protein n=1 Tax=Molorchus minor TaxID=1323400 RepID=A0ABQ9JDP8_9CUCU|nr:hypothetical protein NQ317_008432 [Molorchus minor]